MLYLLAGKHAAKDDYIGKGDADHQNHHQHHHHRHHHNQRQVSDETPTQHTPTKKKLAAAKSFSGAYDHLSSRGNEAPMCRHQPSIKEEHANVRDGTDKTVLSKFPIENILREDGEETKSNTSTPTAERKVSVPERKISLPQPDSTYSPSKRKRSAYSRSATCKDIK